MHLHPAAEKIDQLLQEAPEIGPVAVEAVRFKNGKLVAVWVRRLKPGENPGDPDFVYVNEKGMEVTITFPPATE